MKIAYIVIGAIVVAAVAAAGGFFGGMTYAQSQAQNSVADFARQRAIQNPQGGQGAQGNANDPCGFGNFGRFQGSQGAGQSNPQSGQTNPPSGAQGSQGGGFRGQGGGFFGGFGGFAQMGSCVARGQVKSVNGDTVQISTADKVVTVKVNNNTIISKTDRGTIADLQPGDRVTVFSQETGDSPTASAIQLTRPITPTNQ